jgi:hypothetical protein
MMKAPSCVKNAYFIWSPLKDAITYPVKPEHRWDNTWTYKECMLASEIVAAGYNKSIASMIIYKNRGVTYDVSQEAVLDAVRKRMGFSALD